MIKEDELFSQRFGLVFAWYVKFNSNSISKVHWMLESLKHFRELKVFTQSLKATTWFIKSQISKAEVYYSSTELAFNGWSSLKF